MKQPIKWHEECLKNSKRSLKESATPLEIFQIEYNTHLKRVIFYESQIQEAKKLGKDGFDEERFMKNRKGLQQGK